VGGGGGGGGGMAVRLITHFMHISAKIVNLIISHQLKALEKQSKRTNRKNKVQVL